MTTFALNPVIQRSLKIIEGTFNSVTINLDCPKEIIVNGYQNELIQAILNILNNARDILIEKQIENKLIDIQVTQDEQYAIIQISDNAGGIPDEFLDKIFNSDFTTKGEKGTGIGLYMTNQIITNMNGKINVSNNAQGAVFNILLPLEMVNS
jgi:signal transduction histidine kinase